MNLAITSVNWRLHRRIGNYIGEMVISSARHPVVQNYFDKYNFVIFVISIDCGSTISVIQKTLQKNVSQKILNGFKRAMDGGLTSVVQNYFDKGV